MIVSKTRAILLGRISVAALCRPALTAQTVESIYREVSLDKEIIEEAIKTWKGG